MRTESPVSVVELLDQLAQTSPQAVAVLGPDPRSALTFAQLRDQAFGLAAQLVEMGVRPDDVVLVLHEPGPENLVAILGSMAVSTCAPINPASTPGEMRRFSEDTGAVVVVADRSVDRQAVEAHLGLPVVLPTGRSAPAPSHAPFGAMPALLLHTAGTTAQPKQVPLSHHNILSAASNVVASLALASNDRCLNVMPLFHSHGLIGAALSALMAGGSVVCTPKVDPRRLLEWAAQTDSTWYTAAPTIHRMFLDCPGEWDGFRLMRSASAPLPPQWAAALEQRFRAPLIEVYGMTESYQIAANPLPPGERRSGSVGVATGTEIALLDAAGIVRDSGTGEVLVRGAALFSGYRAPTGADDSAFVDGWFRTGDLGRLDADGYLSLTGRAKDQINKAGEKVAPREVEEALLAHPSVRDALVFGVPDSLLGEDIGCAIVRAEGADLDVAAMRHHVGGILASHKVPKYALFVDDIPKSATGKPQRRVMAERLQHELVQEEHVSTPGPRPTSVDQLAEIWRDVLRLSHLPRREDSFFDLGGDSLAVMAMVVRIEEAFGVDLPLVDVHRVPTLGELSRQIDGTDDSAEDSSSLRLYREGTSGLSLILVPGQLGQAVGLYRIADAVTAGARIYLFDYPGHRPGSRPADTISGIAEALLHAMEEVPEADRLAFYGNSMGSWVVLEAAARLEAVGRAPMLVAMGDMYSPWFNTASALIRPPFVTRAARRLNRAMRRLRARPNSHGTSPEPAAVRRVEIVRRASDRARRSYTPPPYGGDLLVFGTSSRRAKFGPALGYDNHVTGRILTVGVAGDHDAMHVDQADVIGEALSRALTAENASAHDTSSEA